MHIYKLETIYLLKLIEVNQHARFEQANTNITYFKNDGNHKNLE